MDKLSLTGAGTGMCEPLCTSAEIFSFAGSPAVKRSPTRRVNCPDCLETIYFQRSYND